MKKLVNAEQMQAIDSYAIRQIGIPALVLMENAANQIVAVMEEHITKEDIILVICGNGNNGGDGLAVARILLNHGYQVDVFFAGTRSKMTKETRQRMDIVEKMEIVIWDDPAELNLKNYTIYVDALYGVGLSRLLEETDAAVVTALNQEEGIVFSVDVPSGISASTGKVLGTAVKADITVTLGMEKVGLRLHPGYEHAGKVLLADIGFPPVSTEQVSTPYSSYTREDLIRLPYRPSYSHKGTYGKVVVIGGSKNMSGSAYLAAKAAYRTGAGLVEIITHEANRVILQSQLPEAILLTYTEESVDEKDTQKQMLDAIKTAKAIVLGPGLGVNKTAQKIADLITLHMEVPAVLDADTLNIAANLYNQFPLMRGKACLRMNELANSLPPKTILTPHLKELARLMDRPLAEVKEDLLHTADLCTDDSELIFAIKDARTLVAYREERYINLSGNSGMATGGSGDVLTGIIAGLLAQGMDPYEAAKLGVYVHGLAGDHAAAKSSPYSMMASDIIESLNEVLRFS